MCGIVGYIGKKQVVPILIDGLKRLEYRGYDSAGISILTDKGLETTKSRGKLKVLASMVEKNKIKSSMGIGHTRWATHGAPSDRNSHPHFNEERTISLVHNGIIENYFTIKQDLLEKGHKFTSETDTEVLVHLIEEHYEGKDLEKAVIAALKQVEGSYAVGVVSKLEPDKIVAARKDSPLVIGLGKDENFIGSDIPAFLSFTRKVQHVNDYEVVVVTREGTKFLDFEGNVLKRKVTRVQWDSSMAQKSGYRHFMLKEIYEQPKVLTDTLTGRLGEEDVEIEECHLTKEDFQDINRIIITACGTAYHAGMVAKYFFEEIAKVPVELDVASELRYRSPIVDDKTLIVAISQSGETADTLAAFRDVIARGAKSIAITNVVGSSITRETSNIIYTRAGLEIGVAATKTFTVQVVALILLGVKLALAREQFTHEDYKRFKEGLQKLPEQIEEVLKSFGQIRYIARRYYKCEDFLFLGRNISFPIALEGALKLKEISYIHAEGYAAGEMKHGPIALIDKMVPVVSVLPSGPVYDKILSNVKEVKARHAVTIGVLNEEDEHSGEYFDEVILVPKSDYYISPILTNIPLQLLAYFIAVRKNRDVDQPRNLAKSVTVE